jgi:hypothetical protein
MNQDGNDRYVPTQRRLNFDSYKVRFVQGTGAGHMWCQPSLANDRQHEAAFRNLFVKMLPKIGSKGNRVDILENALFTKLRNQPIVNSACDIRAIRSTIVDKN